MTTDPQTDPSKSPLTIRLHLTDGSVHAFVQSDATICMRLRDGGIGVARADALR